MVGPGVLRECLRDPTVSSVSAMGRTGSGIDDAKLHELRLGNMEDYVGMDIEFSGFDACFFCLSATSNGMKEADYARITYGFTMAAAEVLSRLLPGMKFLYVSGAGAHLAGSTLRFARNAPCDAAENAAMVEWDSTEDKAEWRLGSKSRVAMKPSICSSRSLVCRRCLRHRVRFTPPFAKRMYWSRYCAS
jgi:hypothetical protein